jgi:DNA-binding transcriptional MerR regulator
MSALVFAGGAAPAQSVRVAPTTTGGGPVLGAGGIANRVEKPIGDMAREFGVSLRTLRFYEDRGLLSPRREGAARFYNGADRLRMQMILKGKRLGFTLAEISDLIGAKASSTSSEFEEKLQPEQIISQISYLERQRREIEDAIGRLRETYQRIEGVLAPT